MKIFQQLCIILGINVAGEVISYLLHLPLPGSITGMLLLLLLLFTGVVKEEHIRETSNFLLLNMGFFFIPAGVSIMVSYHALKGCYLQALLVVVLSTCIVVAVTGLVSQCVISWRRKKDECHH